MPVDGLTGRRAIATVGADTAWPPSAARAPGSAGEPKGIPLPRLTYLTGLALLLLAGAFLLTDALLTLPLA